MIKRKMLITSWDVVFDMPDTARLAKDCHFVGQMHRDGITYMVYCTRSFFKRTNLDGIFDRIKMGLHTEIKTL
jgi:hypothetical protein